MFRRQMRIKFYGLPEKIIHTRNRFNSGKTAAGHHHREQMVAPANGAFKISGFEIFDEIVAQVNRVTERLHRDCALWQTGNVEEVRDRAEGEHEMIIFQLVFVRGQAVGDMNALVRQINLLHVAVKKAHAPEQLANRIDDVRHVKIAGRNFVQHRREKNKIFSIDESNFHLIMTGDGLVQMQGGIQTAKTAAQDDNFCFLVCIHSNLLLET
ncbi:MAG: hypothetical protein ALAOOOJD_04410 [bacterium]|nr:hypothetical protein [bacterium]